MDGSAIHTEILSGAIDLHVHGAPDLAPRHHSDVQLAHRAKAAGMAGLVLKCHLESTVGRAAMAAEAADFTVFGGLPLNQFVTGGLNPDAVAVSLELGARVIWLPSLGSEAHRKEFARSDDGWDEVCQHPAHIPHTVSGFTIDDQRDGAVVDEICRLVAASDAVLATGHLSTDEIGWLIARAARHRTKVLITHPDYIVPSMTPRQQHELSRHYPEVYFERAAYVSSAGSPQPRPLSLIAEGIRATPPDRNIAVSDLGQTSNPLYPKGYADFLLALHREADFSLDQIAEFACRASARLLGLD